MKNKKIAIRILLILISILCILLPTKVSAMSQAEAGQYIANYARNFFYSKGDLVNYFDGDNDELYRRRGYSTRTGQPWEGSGMYDLDCMGFLSLVVRQSTGIIESDVESGGSSYIWPTCYGGNDKPHIRHERERCNTLVGYTAVRAQRYKRCSSNNCGILRQK